MPNNNPWPKETAAYKVHEMIDAIPDSETRAVLRMLAEALYAAEDKLAKPLRAIFELLGCEPMQHVEDGLTDKERRRTGVPR